MSSTLYRIARACFRARKRVLGAWLLVLAAMSVLAVTAGGTFDDEFAIPGASSQVGLDQLRMTFPEAADASAVLLLVAPQGRLVNDPEIKTEFEDVLAEIGQIDWVKGTVSPFNEHINGMVGFKRDCHLVR